MKEKEKCSKKYKREKKGKEVIAFKRNVSRNLEAFEAKKNQISSNPEKKKKKKKKRKNEKMKNLKTMKKEEIRLHTQKSRRFPGFTVVVVTFFVEIFDDFHDFVSECVSFKRKINNPFWEVTVFPKKSDNFHWT